MSHVKFSKHKELKKICTVPVWMYSIPSTQLFDLLPNLNIEIVTPTYDRWKTTIDSIVDKVGKEFFINDDNVYKESEFKTLAEIYHILHVDKYVEGVINIRQSNKGYYSVQPGVKRVIMLKHMTLHNVHVVCFDKKIPGADRYLIKELPKQFLYTEKEIGPEIHDIEWHEVLKSRLKETPIKVKITNYEVFLNDIIFLKKIAYKAPWKMAYK